MNSNRLARASLLASLLTLLFFCIGFIPIPGTAIPCYPAAGLSGLAALVSGIRALVQIRSSGETGRWMAWTGIFMGGGIILLVVCFTTLTLSALFSLTSLWEYLAPYLPPEWR
jgi:hypothetical protein